MTKKEALDRAFDDALKTLFSTTRQAVDNDVESKQIATGMKEFARKNQLEFTDEEIKATIVAGMAAKAKAGADFSFQNWTMR